MRPSPPFLCFCIPRHHCPYTRCTNGHHHQHQPNASRQRKHGCYHPNSIVSPRHLFAGGKLSLTAPHFHSPRRPDFAFTPVSSTRAVPLSVALLKANPGLNSALKQFETSQGKFEAAFVTPWASSSSSASGSSQLAGPSTSYLATPTGLAEAWRRRASLYSQDEDDDVDEDEDDDSVWGDDEYSDNGEVDEADDDENVTSYFDSEAWRRNVLEEADDASTEDRGRPRQRSNPAQRHRRAPSPAPVDSPIVRPAPPPHSPLSDDHGSAFYAATPPLLPGFKLRLPEHRRRRAGASRHRVAFASDLDERSHFSADSETSPLVLPSEADKLSTSSGEDFSEAALTLYSPTDDTAVDPDEAWERAMRFSGWVRTSDIPSLAADGTEGDCYSPLGDPVETVQAKWEFRGRGNRHGNCGDVAAKAAPRLGRTTTAEGLRRLVEMVQSG